MAADADVAEALKVLYTDPKKPSAFTGPAQLYSHARSAGLKVTLKKVKEFLASLDVYTLHKKINRKFKRNPIYVNGMDVQWGIDLLDFQKIAPHNRGYRYLMVCIDVLSRYLWVRPLKSKKPQEVVKGLRDIFLSSGRRPLRLRSDRGSEFVARVTRAFLKGEGILQMLAGSEHKSSLSERVGQSLKGRIYRYMTHKESHTYIDKLQDFVAGYNNTVHRVLRMKPAAVTKNTEERAFFNLYALPLIKGGQRPKKRQSLKVGQPVRVTVLKDKFERSYNLKWSDELFSIAKVLKQTPKVLYELVDERGEVIKGYFYREELQPVVVGEDKLYTIEKILKTKGKGRNKSYLVSWRGYDASHNSWVKGRDIEPIQRR